MSNFSFNGIEKDYCYYTDYKTSWGQDREINTTDVNGRSGTVLTSVRDKVRKIEVNLLVDSLEVGESLEHVAEDLADWLTTDEPKPIQFAREPDRIYYGILEGAIDKDYFVNFGKATVNFLCIDPYKYASTRTKQTAISDQATLYNAGNKNTPIEIQARALEPSSHFMIAKGYNGDSDEFFMIGDDDVDKPLDNYSPSVLISEMRDMRGWIELGSGSINDNYLGGTTGGELQSSSSNNSIYLNVDTLENNGWNGAGLKKSFSKSVQDFRVTAKILLNNTKKGTAKFSQFVYDVDNRLLASIGYVKKSESRRTGTIIVTLFNQSGEQVKIYDFDNDPYIQGLDSFVIYIALTRKGNEFTVKSWKYDETPYPQRLVPIAVREKTFVDSGNFYQRKVASTTLYQARYQNTDFANIYILGTYNRELLEKPKGARDMIIQKGDDIRVDTENNIVVVNEEPMLQEKTFASDFFNIESGTNELIILPEDTFDTSIFWRDRYL